MVKVWAKLRSRVTDRAAKEEGLASTVVLAMLGSRMRCRGSNGVRRSLFAVGPVRRFYRATQEPASRGRYYAVGQFREVRRVPIRSRVIDPVGLPV